MGNDTTIDYITTASTGNASDFGDTRISRNGSSGCSDGTYGMSTTGNSGIAATGFQLEYVTIASTGNSANWGDISSAQFGANQDGSVAIGGHTRGVLAGAKGGDSNVIEYWTWASTGDTSDFGDLSVSSSDFGDTGCEDTVRGLIYTLGGFVDSTVGRVNIDYITIATTGNASDFGDAVFKVEWSGGFSNGTRAESWAGVYQPGGTYTTLDSIEYVTIQSTGNGTDQGNLDEPGQSFCCAEGSA